MPGIVQSSFLHRIGGSSRVRSDLAAALGEGRGVTAKIRWLTKADEDGEGEGRPRWIHCTPLVGHSGSVGVWMIVLVDEEGSQTLNSSGRRFRPAPPVSTNIGGKEWDSQRPVSSTRDRKLLNSYDADADRKSTRRTPSAAPSQLERNRPRRSFSGRKYDGVASGDVSEFSFQLK